MAEFRKPAVKIIQGKRTLFLTCLTVRDFMTEDFYRVDRLDVREATGMQRLLNNARARSFGNDIIGADKVNEAFLPTSVFLATSGSISYDESTKELFFDSAVRAGICPLDVVDGQHRIEGLKYAAKENKRLQNFPIAAVISPNMNEPEKMLQFVVVNTRQRPVDRGVAQHITARFTKMLEVEKLPYLPGWLRKEVEKGDDEHALIIAKSLNDDSTSPWYGRIQFANEMKGIRHTIKQATFVKSVKSLLLAKNHSLNQFRMSKRLHILRNYWTAVENIFVAPSDMADGDTGASSVVFKYSGLEFFHSILSPLINQLARNREYTVNAMESYIRSTEEYLPPDYIKVLSPTFWQKGGEVSGLNKGAMSKLASMFSEALTEAHSNEIEL